MGKFSDFDVSLKMRDLIKRLVRDGIEKERPRYRYGTVVEVSPTTNKCTVTLTGDENPVIVNMMDSRPVAAGQIVRVDGIGTDRFVAGVGHVAGDYNGAPFAQAAGTFDIPANGTTSSVGLALLFPAGRFTQIPIVTCNVLGPGSGLLFVNPYAISTTGVEFAVVHRDAATWAGTTYKIHWHAIQMTSSTSEG